MNLRFIAANLAAALVVALPSQSARALQAERSMDPSDSRIPVGSASLYARTIGRGLGGGSGRTIVRKSI